MSQDRMKVSVIVPVYKVEKYLRRCVDSILAQTYQEYEVFLVDDGSPDDCGRICDEYAAKDARIKVIHQENRGQAAARNRAVKESSGDSIVFVDSDDYVAPDYIEYLVALKRKYSADIAIGGYRYFFEGAEILERKEASQEFCMDRTEALNRLNYTMGYGAFPWAKLYSRKLILNHPFPEGQIYEDLAVLYQIFADTETVAFGNLTIYYWQQREGSTMRSSFDDRQMAAIAATKAQVTFMEKLYPEILPSAKARHECKIIELMAIAMNSSDRKEAFYRLRKESKYYHEVLRNKHVKKSAKIRMIAMRFGYLLTVLVFRLHERIKMRLFG